MHLVQCLFRQTAFLTVLRENSVGVLHRCFPDLPTPYTVIVDGRQTHTMKTFHLTPTTKNIIYTHQFPSDFVVAPFVRSLIFLTPITSRNLEVLARRVPESTFVYLNEVDVDGYHKGISVVHYEQGSKFHEELQVFVARHLHDQN